MQKRLNHEKKLDSILINTSKRFFKYKGFHIFKLIAMWQNIAKDYSEICTPINIQKQQNLNILYLEVEDEAIIFELEYNKDHIICLINQYFGQEHIHKLKFKLAHNKPEIKKTAVKSLKNTNNNHNNKDITNKLTEITDNNLKSKLFHLMHHHFELQYYY